MSSQGMLSQGAASRVTPAGLFTPEAAADADADRATRHLCAGVYLDREFRDKVIGKVRNDSGHRVAPSCGFDLVPVALHAWRAWWLETAGQAFLCAVLAVAVVLDVRAVVTAACGAGIWYLGRTALRNAPEVARLRARSASARWLRRTTLRHDNDRHQEVSRLVAVSAGGCVVLAVIGGVAAASHGPLSHGILAAAVLLASLVAGAALAAAARQLALNHIRAAESLKPARLGKRLKVIDQQQDSDHVVYHKPPPIDPAERLATGNWDYELTRFTGSGKLVNRWLPPLTVPLLRPGAGSMRDREYKEPPFTAYELIDYLKAAMKPVGDAADPARLRGFDARDRLFLAEADVLAGAGDLNDRRFLKERHCPQERVRKVADNPHADEHHYLEIRVTTSGEVVTTVFLRVTIRGRTLSLESATCALTRTPVDYQVIGQYAEAGPGAVLRAAARGALSLPQALGATWRLLLAPWILGRAAWARKDRTVKPRRRRPVGTRFSVREDTAEDWNEAELDKITIYDEMKIIEQRLLKAIEDFLDFKEVDTSAFRRRVTSIINMGMLNMGRIEAGNIAAGPGGQVNYGQGNSTSPNITTSIGGQQSAEGGTP